MFHRYFEYPRVLQGLKSASSKSYLDSFAEELGLVGYAREHIRNRLRAAAHFCIWAEGRKIAASDFNEAVIEQFRRHLPRCRCPGPDRGKSGPVIRFVLRFVDHLRRIGVAPTPTVAAKGAPLPALLQNFLVWMQQHCGVGAATLYHYAYHLAALLRHLGEDTSAFTAQNLRDFVQERSKHYAGGARKIFTAVRMFLRYLVVEGKCPAGLEYALPPVASWSQQALPRYLSPADIERLIGACDSKTNVGIRDRAIILLLARLGLRAGDVASLRLSDISWPEATLRVKGKGQKESLLPLPQEVGDAILAYLEFSRRPVASDFLFLRCCAPFRPFAHGGPVSLIVRRALLRSGVKAPSLGSHILRHSAATEMLRQGTPLYAIATVLRHRSIQTTTLYAKVDLDLLRQVAQPWPEVLR